VGGTGLEHPSKSSGFPGYLPEGGAESGAVGAQSAQFPPDLAAVVAAWPDLPETVRREVVGLVRAADKTTRAAS
jgi:hypothetical protein